MGAIVRRPMVVTAADTGDGGPRGPFTIEPRRHRCGGRRRESEPFDREQTRHRRREPCAASIHSPHPNPSHLRSHNKISDFIISGRVIRVNRSDP
jgi:hypothetical protein